ncbi:hypothetical protein [Klebsiella pneumoniae]|uniref:hypothetical protein n=1 Tax=Klebsiella pneumoniae TaxID=573 RepID=UPI001E3375B5|nr:hypothetical protein [Klebsiella pneumoniae]
MATYRVYYGQDRDREYFERIFQSANINFIIGSGASLPAISVLGDIESELEALVRAEMMMNTSVNLSLFWTMYGRQTTSPEAKQARRGNPSYFNRMSYRHKTLREAHAGIRNASNEAADWIATAAHQPFYD